MWNQLHPLETTEVTNRHPGQAPLKSNTRKRRKCFNKKLLPVLQGSIWDIVLDKNVDSAYNLCMSLDVRECSRGRCAR